MGIRHLAARVIRRVALGDGRPHGTRGGVIAVAAMGAILVAGLLVGRTWVVPKTPLEFQPAFQTRVAGLLGSARCWNARRVSIRLGRPVRAVTTDPPLE